MDPNEGMEAVRKLDAAARELDVRSAQVFPAGLLPQVPINDKKMYPLYAKCVELDIPIFVNAGVPGPRVPMGCQDVALIDEVCWFFPELKLVMRHGAEPWTALAVKLMLKWPNLYYSTSAFAPKHYPDDIVYFANTRGADKVMYAGYFPMGLSLDRIFSELPAVGFRDHVWPKFLRENATRLLRSEPPSEPGSIRGRARRRRRSTPPRASPSRARRCSSSTSSSESRRATPRARPARVGSSSPPGTCSRTRCTSRPTSSATRWSSCSTRWTASTSPR